jgi:transformation/transcription domain-associated protein
MPKSIDEKELLEYFSGLFLTMTPQTSKKSSRQQSTSWFTASHNITLQVITTSFLASPSTSPLIATVLIEFSANSVEETER